MDEIEKVVKENITLKTKISICKMIERGILVFKRIESDNETLFQTDLASNIMPRLLSYCINRQFAPDMLEDMEYEVYIKNVNSFKYKIVELKNQNIILHVCKSKTLLPNRAKYKLELASTNIVEENQQVMEIFKNDIIRTKNSPYYGIISYDLDKMNNINSINIVVPNYNMQSVIYSENIYKYLNKFEVLDNNENKEVEKRVVTIKQELKKMNVL